MYVLKKIMTFIPFFLSVFFSRILTIHRIAREGGDYFFSSFLPLPPASQTLRH